MTPPEGLPQSWVEALLDDDPEELYQRAPCGLLSTTPDGELVRVNKTFLDWTGYRREDLVGRRSFVSLLSPGGRLYHETHYAPMLQMQGQVREVALELVRADGSRLPVLINAVLDRDPDGEPRAARVVLLDATERRRYEQELLLAKQRAEASELRARELARTLQQTLLPPAPPTIPGLDFSAAFRPAGHGAEVGGDFWDAFQIGPDDWVVVLGDVCGKGVEAAVVTSLVRHTLRAVVIGLHAPSQALAVLNEVLLVHETDRFCTVVLVRLQRQGATWRATLGSGGHPAPLLLSPGSPAVPVSGSGPLVGVLDNARFEDRRLTLGVGDKLLLFTDGVTEGRRDRELYGDARLRSCAERHRGSTEELASAVLEDVVMFQHGNPRDDVAVVALGVPG
ncbi:PP2C family protein-serine/threonine phosphatase [Nocardioides mesophilus]|uniref:SpoIIE family protein phosphatase n=1 Tax=Nocardioides mesophilus TaxID=433659 RepID=A0A7G9R9W4_9ACTN|nr:SpoIIE family protein phosphatase [Nocardioides mesophilus]QNN52389.1 SpoIIE family protein phosphatase [Nocardioides mesophilus]